MAETSTVGEINERTSSFRDVIWKIKKFFSLSTEEGYKIRSPTFHFAAVNCNLSICPNGTKNTPGEVIVSLFLRTVEWKHENPPVTCEMGLLSNDGKLVKNSVTQKALKNGTFMTCNFKKSEILKSKDLIHLEESLTIFCKLTIGENSRIEESLQTEPQVKTISGEWVFPRTEDDIEVLSTKEAFVQTDQRCSKY